MATVDVNGSAMGTALQQILVSDDIQPGSDPSYQTCKTIYLYHPMGAKIAEKPLEIAQSQKRKISIPDAPEDFVKEAYEAEWLALNADGNIFNTMAQARVYGITSIACLIDGIANEKPIDFKKLWEQSISFNVYDPLNTAGSLVLNQNPLSMDFQHTTEIRVSGSTFHRSRTCVVMNEKPIYIAYSSSAFGFTGRSVYQRSLYPLKSFVQTMVTDDLVSKKVGLIIAKIKQSGAMINNAMNRMFGTKREVLKIAATGNVLSIGTEDTIESIDLTNLDGPHALARKHIIENIASATPMPAKLLTEESFAEGFGEGTEDAKSVARYISKVREQMDPLYKYFDKIVFHRAINPEFYKIIQRKFPDEYADVSYETAFYRWWNSFTWEWPNLLEEPDSEKVKVDEVKLRAVVALVEVLMPNLQGEENAENRAEVIKWMVDNFNDLKLLFGAPLNLDYTAIVEAFENQGNQVEGDMGSGEEPGEFGVNKTPTPPKPPGLGRSDAAIVQFTGAVQRMVESRKARRDTKH